MLANIVETYGKPANTKSKSHALIFRRGKDEKDKKPIPTLKDGAKTSRSSTALTPSTASSIHDSIRKVTSDAFISADHADPQENPQALGMAKEREERRRRIQALQAELRLLESEANVLLGELGRPTITEREREERRERAQREANLMRGH